MHAVHTKVLMQETSLVPRLIVLSLENDGGRKLLIFLDVLRL